jgi:hypothetical protein
MKCSSLRRLAVVVGRKTELEWLGVLIDNKLPRSHQVDQNTLVKKIAVSRQKVPELAFTLMIAGILVPTAMYSFRLSSPSPAELLVAVSIALFASVLFLWIMDATGILPFRAAWISKAVYGAAITSILGTSVAVYKDYFFADKYPYVGAWQVMLTKTADATHPTEFSLVLSYSQAGDRYWGYSNLVATSTDPKTLIWVEAVDVSPQQGSAMLRLHFGDGSQQVIQWYLYIEKKGKFLKSREPSSQLILEMRRPA